KAPRDLPARCNDLRDLRVRVEKLLRRHEMHAPVPRVALLVLLTAERQLLAVADRREPVPRDAERREVVLDGLGAPSAEREVVLDRAALVAVSLDLGARARVALQPLGVRGEDVACAAVELVGVVGEVDVLQHAALFRVETMLEALEAAALGETAFTARAH